MRSLGTILISLIVFCSCASDSSPVINDLFMEDDDMIPSINSANDFLSDHIYKRLVIEVVYIEGHEPTDAALNNLVSFINERTFKPNGIQIESRSIPSPNTSPYTIQDILSIESANRTETSSSDKLALWVLFIDGEFASNSSGSTVLGAAYQDTSFVIFQESIEAISGGILQPDRTVVESVVINHEMGHLLGLTNFKSPMQTNHEDTSHPKHCDVQDCLMYWSIETGEGIVDLLSGGQIPELDAQCIADLQANGGK